MERNSTPSICKMGCGFFGNHSLGGMCSKCHKESVLSKTLSNEQLGTETSSSQTASTSQINTNQGKQAKKTSLHKEATKPADSETVTKSDVKTTSEGSGTSVTAATSSTAAAGDSASGSTPPPPKKRNRCFSCRKRVGLTGMECRCGEIFCGLHRYSDKHNCPFDYKTDGRKRLAEENPIIVGEKVRKI